MFRATGNGRGLGILLVEADDTVVVVGFNNAKLMGMAFVYGQGGDSAGRVQMPVKLHHVRDVHPIDVVGTKNGDYVRVGLFNQVDVLVDGVSGPLIPGFADRPHLRRHRNDELALQQASHLPAFAQVLQKTLAAELGQHVDRMDPRVDEIAENEVNNAIFAAKGDGRFGPFLG